MSHVQSIYIFRFFGLVISGIVFYWVSKFYYDFVPSIYFTDLVGIQYYLENYTSKPVISFENFGINLLEPAWHNLLYLCNVMGLSVIKLHIILFTIFCCLYCKNYAQADRLIIFTIGFIAFPSFSSLLIGNTKALSCIVITVLCMPKFFDKDSEYSNIRTLVTLILGAGFHIGLAVLLQLVRFAMIKGNLNVAAITYIGCALAIILFIAPDKISALFSYYILKFDFLNFAGVRYILGWHLIVHLYLILIMKRTILPCKIITCSFVLVLLGSPVGIRLLDIIPLFYIHVFYNSVSPRNLLIYSFGNVLLLFLYLMRFI